ncbi:hypothetical protein GJ744_010851 [Endocarpon pusillum]|uniref:Uncharacterized protein n=1 Tax=Endocarpon pusillum TaxID=364733 RepID=A0A8H7AGU0_9EURO|nr:hypothetical protein GJ744_010851 [Endocarpon pusillum]
MSSDFGVVFVRLPGSATKAKCIHGKLLPSKEERVQATSAVKLCRRLRLDLLWVFAGEIGVAVAGAGFHCMAAREVDVVDSAHLPGYDWFDRIRNFLGSFLGVYRADIGGGKGRPGQLSKQGFLFQMSR